MKLMICIPSGNTWEGLTGKCIAEAMTQFQATKFKTPDGEEIAKDIALTNITGSHLPDQRHKCVFAALEADATHMVFVDSDVTFPADAFVRMILHKLPVVAANFPRHQIPTTTTAYVDTTDNIATGDVIPEPKEEYIGPLFSPPEAEGLIEVQSVGTGLMMIAMPVFDLIDTPWFCFEPQPPNGMRQIGEDVFFCRQCRKKDIPIIVDQDLSKNCGHLGQIEFSHSFVDSSTSVFEKLYTDKKMEFEREAQRQRKVKEHRRKVANLCPGCGCREGEMHADGCETMAARLSEIEAAE